MIKFIALGARLRIVKTADGPLYGFWGKHRGIYGKLRVAREWLKDFHWSLVDPSPGDLANLDLFLGHDEFWAWSSGKVETKGS